MRYPYPNELYHYGILGMKWGVRRYQNPDGSLTSEGAKRYSRFSANMGNRVLGRIDEIKKSKRYQNMSDRQKVSLKKSEAYWEERAQGKRHRDVSQKNKRNFIKRDADRYRSFALGNRASMHAALGLVNSVQSISSAKAFGKEARAGRIIASNLISQAGDMAFDELLNRAFGHY